MITELLSGGVGYMLGKRSNAVTLPEDLDDATADELRAVIEDLRSQLAARQLELAALTSSSQNAISALQAEIATLQQTIAALQAQLANGTPELLFSRSIDYLGGVEKGLLNDLGQISIQGASLSNFEITLDEIQASDSTGRMSAYQAAPIHSYALKSLNVPNGSARQVTLSSDSCFVVNVRGIVHPTHEEVIDVSGTPTTINVVNGNQFFLVIEFDPSTPTALLRNDRICSISRTVYWPRRNVVCVPISNLENAINIGFFIRPAVAKVIGTHEFMGTTYDLKTIGGAVSSQVLTIKRASVLSFPPSNATEPTGFIRLDGRMYVSSVLASMLSTNTTYAASRNITTNKFVSTSGTTHLVHNHDKDNLIPYLVDMWGEKLTNFY